jgi:hypothetical protein
MYRTGGEHANDYTTDEPMICALEATTLTNTPTDEPTIYRTGGEHANDYTTDEPTIYRT